MNNALTPKCTLGSPQRKLNVRPQSTKSPRRHQNTYAVTSEGHTWITKTLHQLQSSTSIRPPSLASPRHSTLCSICRTPLENPYYSSCRGHRSPARRRSQPSSRIHSVAPALQASTDGVGNGPPNGNGNNGTGGSGDGSSNSSGHDSRHRETPLTDTKQVKGLEDILLLDVQGQLDGNTTPCMPALRAHRRMPACLYVQQQIHKWEM